MGGEELKAVFRLGQESPNIPLPQWVRFVAADRLEVVTEEQFKQELRNNVDGLADYVVNYNGSDSRILSGIKTLTEFLSM